MNKTYRARRLVGRHFLLELVIFQISFIQVIDDLYENYVVFEYFLY